MTDSTGDLVQGDVRLLQDPIAQGLLQSRELARLAYTAKDDTPRVIPIGWLWTGTDFLFATFGRSPKLAALRRRPAVALTIDRAGPPPEVLLVRGPATVRDVEAVDGVPDEYRQMQARYYGEKAAQAAVSAIRQSGAPMAVVTVRPTWVATMDFRSRFPSALVDAGLTG